ncbi:MAG: abortive infection family protein [Bryocella sp.]
MFLLYYGSGSREVDLVQETNPAIWGLMRKKAVNYLTISGIKESASLLSQLPFEHWAGSNSFGDAFDLLYLRISIAQYLQMKLDAEMPENRQRFRLIADAMEEGGNPIRFIAVSMIEDNADAVSTPTLEITSAVVERALLDFETLIKSNGAISGIDRVHTALHGYLIAVCKDANIPAKDNADITTLFNLVRQQHPKFQANAGTETQKMLRRLAQIVDTMNPVRNHSSLAHPNDDLLEEPEAMLAANAVRSLLHYLNMKLS